MKILHIIKSKQTDLAKKIIEHQSKTNEVKVVNLTKKVSYEDVIDDIFSHDKVISW
jgi:hypothetical protein